MISAREIACIRHSGSYAKSWQNKFLQKNPDNQNSDDYKEAFHSVSSIVVIQNVRKRREQQFHTPGSNSFIYSAQQNG